MVAVATLWDRGLRAASRHAMSPRHLCWALVAAALQPANAQIFSSSGTQSGPIAIADNSAVGAVQSLYVDSLTSVVRNLQVRVNIQSQSGALMYNGDLYLTLVHNGTSVVLMNRVGRREGFSAGYGEAGFNVTFDDAAAADIHNYRLALTGGDFVPLESGNTPGILTGTWQPDGRTADPSAVLATSPRTTSLSLFTGASANGTWSLFMSDLAPGGAAELVGWELSINPVPEPRDIALLTGFSLLALGLWRRSRWQ